MTMEICEFELQGGSLIYVTCTSVKEYNSDTRKNDLLLISDLQAHA